MAMEETIKKFEQEGNTDGLKRLQEEAEASFDGATVGLAEKAIARLNAVQEKAKESVTTPSTQISQVESLSGTNDELSRRTEAVDAEIAKLRAETKAQIEAITEKQTVVEEVDKSKFETKEQIEAKLVEAKRFQKAKHAMSRWQDLYWAIKEGREIPDTLHVEKWKGEGGIVDDYSAEMERLEKSEELAPWKENFKIPPGENGYWNNWANPIALDMEKSYVDFLKNAGLSEKYKVYNVMIPSELFDQIPKDLEEEISKIKQERGEDDSARSAQA